MKTRHKSGVWARIGLTVPVLGLLIGCDVFATRDPEPPQAGIGTWLQPDTPDRVVDNLRTAVTEMNSGNYLRSLDADFAFEPSQAARAREAALWQGWGRADEETYFSRLVASSGFSSGHDLQLLDQTENVLSDEKYVFDANYILTVRHSRTAEDIPTEFQGRLIWEIERSEEGLWYLHRWVDVDSESQTVASWSELKASFVK
ncbi:MAG TPA: hypothetical protein VJB15_04635 [Rhodothermia bacterium]|nr:hypothetical protein [Rhodothermia bacterium]